MAPIWTHRICTELISRVALAPAGSLDFMWSSAIRLAMVKVRLTRCDSTMAYLSSEFVPPKLVCPQNKACPVQLNSTIRGRYHLCSGFFGSGGAS